MKDDLKMSKVMLCKTQDWMYLKKSLRKSLKCGFVEPKLFCSKFAEKFSAQEIKNPLYTGCPVKIQKLICKGLKNINGHQLYLDPSPCDYVCLECDNIIEKNYEIVVL